LIFFLRIRISQKQKELIKTIHKMSPINLYLSLYIPRVFINITEERIIQTFHSLNIGSINYIDFIKKCGKNGNMYNSIYIHFHMWYENDIAINFQKKILGPNRQAKLVYDDPWYWIVFENTACFEYDVNKKRQFYPTPTSGFHICKRCIFDNYPYEVLYDEKSTDEFANIIKEEKYIQDLEDSIRESKVTRDYINMQLMYFSEENKNLENIIEKFRDENKRLLDELQLQQTENESIMSQNCQLLNDIDILIREKSWININNK